MCMIVESSVYMWMFVFSRCAEGPNFLVYKSHNTGNTLAREVTQIKGFVSCKRQIFVRNSA